MLLLDAPTTVVLRNLRFPAAGYSIPLTGGSSSGRLQLLHQQF